MRDESEIQEAQAELRQAEFELEMEVDMCDELTLRHKMELVHVQGRIRSATSNVSAAKARLARAYRRPQFLNSMRG